MKFLGERWERFWFQPCLPLNLGICRALFFAFVFFIHLTSGFSAWSGVTPALWFPIPLFRELHIPVFSAPTLFLIDVAWKASLLAAALGLATKTSSIMALVLGVYRLGLPHNFGKTHHVDAIIVLVSGILALAHTADAFSLDGLLWRSPEERARRRETASAEYRWPVRCVWMLLSIVMFAAGVAKLRNGGLAWIMSDNMASLLLQSPYGVDKRPWLWTLGAWFARHPLLCHALALMTVATECSYPIALFSRRARWFILAAGAGLLIGIPLVFGPVFLPLLLCHLFWVPWDRVASVLAPRRREPLSGPPPTADARA